MPRSPSSTSCLPSSTTAAPAPSPNSTQVVRSVQSRMREIGLGADHQRALGQAVLEEAVGGGDGIDEARADRLDIEGGAVVHAELLLDDRGGRREGHVGRRRRDDDQVDVVVRHAGIRPAPCAGRVHGEIGGVLALGGDVALPDAGALHDPLVGGVDHLATVRHWS